MSEPEKKGIIRRSVSRVGREASYVFGFEHVRLGAGSVSKQWARLRRRPCPDCDIGSLHPFVELIDGEEKKFLGCNNCAHYQSKKINDDADSLDRMRRISIDKIEALSADEVSELLDSHKKKSRLLYSISLLMVMLGIYLLCLDIFSIEQKSSYGISYLSVTLVSIFFFVKGLEASYRFWQIQEKILFVPGSFLKWLSLGKWLV